jgi:hypothetical protein
LIVKNLRKDLLDKFNSTLWDIVARSLFSDNNISLAANEMGITPEDRIVRKDRNSKLEFYLLPEAFEDWKLTHENHLGLTFTL